MTGFFQPVCERHSVCIAFTLRNVEDVVGSARANVHVVADAAEAGRNMQSPAPQVGK